MVLANMHPAKTEETPVGTLEIWGFGAAFRGALINAREQESPAFSNQVR